MPTEHEFKYVLRICLELEDAILEDRFASVVWINQGYLKGDVRIRRIKASQGGPSWIFTFKQKVGNRVIEIETPLDARDGEDLHNLSFDKVRKCRHTINYRRLGQRWEVDFLHDEENNWYFALAEIEMKEGEEAPTELPFFIKDFLVYKVPLTDDRFSNRKLGDVKYASDLYLTLTQGGADNVPAAEL